MATTNVQAGQSLATSNATVYAFTSAPAGIYEINALRANSGLVWIGYPGTTTLTSQNGYELNTSGLPTEVSVTNLNELLLKAANDGDGVCWIRKYGQVIGVYPPAI